MGAGWARKGFGPLITGYFCVKTVSFYFFSSFLRFGLIDSIERSLKSSILRSSTSTSLADTPVSTLCMTEFLPAEEDSVTLTGAASGFLYSNDPRGMTISSLLAGRSCLDSDVSELS